MATSNGKSKKRMQKEADKDLSKTYNQFKEFEGHKYTGMKIGRSHIHLPRTHRAQIQTRT